MKILFLCVENAGRSQMAEAFARAEAPPGVEVFSAGSHPGTALHPVVVETMREAGFDLSKNVPKGLDALPEGKFDWVVGMGCGDACPAARAGKVILWEITNPKNKSAEEVRRIRDEIRLNVRRLMGPLRPVRFRLWPTLLAGSLLLLSIGFLLSTPFLMSPLMTVPYPERALARVAGRTLQLREAVAQLPAGERRLHAFFDPSLGSEEELRRLMGWHREAARFAKDPVILAHMGVLEGETGQLDLLQKQTARWAAEAPDPIPAYARLLQAAYVKTPDAGEATLQAQPAELLPPTWFRDRLQERIYDRTGAPAAAEKIRETGRRESGRLLDRYRLMTGLDLFTFLLFIAGSLIFFRTPRGFWKAVSSPLPAPWPFHAGMTVLIRGAGLGLLLTFLFSSLFPYTHPAATTISYFLWTLPILLLFRHYLLRPNRLSLVQEFGLRVPFARWGKLLFITLLGLGADSAGTWLIGTAGAFLPNHWAEGFDTDLVFGPRGALLAAVAGIVLVGPFFEELTFRGLLYGTLRGRVGRFAAMALSGLFFSMVHGYGALGFLTVFWSGLVFAWIYEESGSLWPPILVHVAGNLLYSLNVLSILRWS